VIKQGLRLVRLHEHSVGLQLLNQLLSALGEHGGLVGGADEVDFLAIEALSEVNERRLEAVLSVDVRAIGAYLSPTRS